MKTFRIDREITSSDGTQSFACEAENAEEAGSIFKNGGGVLIDHEHTVEGLAPIEYCEVYATDEGITPYDGSIKPVKVKPLIWSAYDDECDEARAVGSMYFVAKSSDTGWFYSVDDYIESDDYATKEEAKKDAEEHYEKLILGSIE